MPFYQHLLVYFLVFLIYLQNHLYQQFQIEFFLTYQQFDFDNFAMKFQLELVLFSSFELQIKAAHSESLFLKKIKSSVLESILLKSEKIFSNAAFFQEESADFAIFFASIKT